MTGMVIGGLVISNIVGAPEVEVGEGASAAVVAGVKAWQFLSGFGLEAANTIANGGFLGGALGGSIGMTTGLLATPSTCAGGK